MEIYKGRFYSILMIILSICSTGWYFYKVDSSLSKIGTLWIIILSIIVLYFYIRALIIISNSEFYSLKAEDNNLYIHNEASYFIKNSFINNETKNINQITNNFINQITEKEKNNINISSKDEFDDNLILKIVNLVKELKIKEPKHFLILIYFIKENFHPLKTDKWLIDNFLSIFKITINNQYFSTVKNELDEIRGLKDLSNLTRAQKKSYILFQNIENYFNVYNHE